MEQVLMELKYILFDMDGVIIDSRRSITECTLYTLSQYNMVPTEEQLSKIIGPPLYRIYTEIFGFDSETAKEAIRIYKKYYDEHAIPLVTLFPGVEDMLSELYAHGKKLMIATARYREVTEAVLDRLDVLKYFCFVGSVNASPGTTEPGARTCKSDVISYCLTENGIYQRENAVMIGDRAEDIEGGKANGIKTFGAAYGFAPEGELLNAAPDRIFKSPLEISRYIIENYE